MQILLIVGVSFLFFGIKVLRAQLILRKQPSSVVSGNVIGYEKRRSKSRRGRKYTFGGYSYAPIFQYYYNGKTRTVSHSFSTNSEDWLNKNFPEGKTVELRVYEKDVDNAVLNTGFGLNIQIILSIIFIIIGVITLGIGVFGIICIVMGVGDYYNVINALTQMPKEAKTYLHKFNSYWYLE